MAKRVLGNDPFRRGAADRTGPAEAAPPAERPAPARKATNKKAGAKTAGAKTAAPKRSAPRKPPAAPPREAAHAGATLAPTAEPASAATSHAAPPGAAASAVPAPPPATPPAARAEQPAAAAPATGAAPVVEEVPPGEPAPAAEPTPLTLEPEALPEQGLPPDEAEARVEVEERAAEAADPGRAAPEHGGGGGAALAGQALRLLGIAREVASHAVSRERLERGRAAATGLWGALRAGLGTSGSTALDAYGRDPALVAELRPVLDYLYETYWRVELSGAEHLPEGPAVLVANHSGALPYDGLVLHLALARARPTGPEPRWLVEDQIFHTPVVGTLLNRLGAVRASPENAQRLLAERRLVAVFPEGFQGLSKPYAERYQLKRFGRGGFLKLALRAGVPVLPVAIVGAEETSPLLGRLPGGALGLPFVPLTAPAPLPAKWLVRVGAPLPLEGLGPGAADDLAEVQRLTERTREDIQGMLQALLRERRSVFAG